MRFMLIGGSWTGCGLGCKWGRRTNGPAKQVQSKITSLGPPWRHEKSPPHLDSAYTGNIQSPSVLREKPLFLLRICRVFLPGASMSSGGCATLCAMTEYTQSQLGLHAHTSTITTGLKLACSASPKLPSRFLLSAILQRASTEPFL